MMLLLLSTQVPITSQLFLLRVCLLRLCELRRLGLLLLRSKLLVVRMQKQETFKYIPVVTITPVNVGQNTPGSNVNVTIREVTTSKVVYDVRYNATGNVSLSVDIMAIGLPN